MKLILLILFAFFVLSCNEDDSPENKEVETYFTSEFFEYEKDSINLVVKAEYPLLKPNDLINNQKINQFITKAVKFNIEQFENGIVPMDKFDDFIDDAKNEFIVKDSVFLLNDNIFSFYLIYSYYELGAAHPNTYHETFNFNLRTGNLIEITDVFRNDIDFIAVLSNAVTGKLSNNDSDNIQTGVLGNNLQISDYQNYILTDKSIILIFESYAFASYAEGPQFINIPFIEIQEYLDKSKMNDIGIVVNEIG